VARILIVAGGCRGRRLAAELVREGHVVRITTRSEASRAAIEACGAECWIGAPDRLATLARALENVTVLCWLLGSASGARAQMRALHTLRLESFLVQAIDTTVRGFVYEAAGRRVSPEVVAEGGRIVRAIAERNAVPVALLGPSSDSDAWLAQAKGAVSSVLQGRPLSPSP
jgi:Trk K+ transport system NAD-binding subunit